ncbi:hypothetical protein NGR_b17640 (plasmid) [Sinorhizobium fredii NGR234]|uniref:Uncharacterized protein n=2 Tax=Sinorhizobium fredii (strain NBRC 101917 / NGR234) TaxID=394 RepID=C3KLC9_SINFN|nr:hypothetical protein NGR_b17640 [Sinorhizobium fredii NGR234]
MVSLSRIVNCTGMERAGVAHSPLLKQMQQQGLITRDLLGLGLSVDAGSRVLGGKGERGRPLCGRGL